MQKIYQVKGMTCASCAYQITKTLTWVAWIEKSDVNVATSTLAVAYDPEKVSLDMMNELLSPKWYTLSDKDIASKGNADVNNSDDAKRLKHMRQRIFIVLPFVLLSFIYMIADVGGKELWWLPIMPDWLYTFWHHLFPVMATYVLFVIGKNYLVALRKFVKTWFATMETLIGLWTLVWFLYSFAMWAFEKVLAPYLDVSIHYYDVVIVVIWFISYGKYLEMRSTFQTGEAIKQLLHLQAKTALIERDGVEVEIAIEALQKWDIVVIKPGSKVSVDGTIVYGETSIDESMITWESLPVDKQVGDRVIWWTINKQWFIKVEAMSLGSDSMLSHIITMVQNAQGSRAPVQKLVDKISSKFVPLVLLIAIISLIAWIILWNPAIGIVCFVSVLVIACPCALWLATPTAIIVWVGKWAQNGILIKNAESLQKLLKVTAVVFDKTGTVTQGKPIVVWYIWNNEKANMAILASLEQRSEHPLAQAILDYARQTDVSLQEVTSFQAIQWKWVQWYIQGQTRYAGNLALMKEQGKKYDEKVVEEALSKWETLIFLANDTDVVATIRISDTIKQTALSAIQALQKRHIKTVMLTWDTIQTAQSIAAQLGLDDVRAQVLPHQKAEVIRELQAAWYIVAMCGDGVNDAPALACADVGIAMGTWTDVAIETADITLLWWDLNALVKALRLSKATMATIKQNLFWAFIYNVIGIPLAAGVFSPFLLNPVFAGMAMALSSVSVVTNSLRLKTKKL